MVKKGIQWNDEKVAYLKKWREKGASVEALTEMISLKFKVRCTFASCEGALHRYDINSDSKRLHRWTEEEIEELRKLYDLGFTHREITKILNNKFGKERTLGSVTAQIKKHCDNLRSPGKRTRWIDEEIEHQQFLSAFGFSDREAAGKMTDKFGRNFTAAMIEHQRCRRPSPWV